jgi:hypothetical protein
MKLKNVLAGCVIALSMAHVANAQLPITGFVLDLPGHHPIKVSGEDTGKQLLITDAIEIPNTSCLVTLAFSKLAMEQDISVSGRVEKLVCLDDERDLFSGMGSAIGTLSENGTEVDSIKLSLWF